MRTVLSFIIDNEPNIEVPVDIWPLKDPLVVVQSENVHRTRRLQSRLHVQDVVPSE